MPQVNIKKLKTDTAEATNGAAPTRKPSEQALEYVDVSFGLAPRLAEEVRKRVEKLRDPSTRDQELKTLQQQFETLRNPATRDAELEKIRQLVNTEVEKAKEVGPDRRRKATRQFVEQAKKARKRVEKSPVYKQVEPVYKKRVEPVVKQRVEPVYKQRVEPTVKRTLERV